MWVALILRGQNRTGGRWFKCFEGAFYEGWVKKSINISKFVNLMWNSHCTLWESNSFYPTQVIFPRRQFLETFKSEKTSISGIEKIEWPSFFFCYNFKIINYFVYVCQLVKNGDVSIFHQVSDEIHKMNLLYYLYWVYSMNDTWPLILFIIFKKNLSLFFLVRVG